MRSLHRPFWVAILMVALGVGLVGCTEEGGDTRNIVQVFSINDNLPLLSDVYDFGENKDINETADDFIPVDIVEVTFISRPHDDALSTVRPGAPFGTVTMHTYEVVFGDGSNPNGADLDGDGNADLLNFRAPMSALIPTNGAGQAFILIVDGGSKVTQPIVCLGPFGGCTTTSAEFGVNAAITFYGTEETSGDEVVVTSGLTIRIAQFGDE